MEQNNMLVIRLEDELKDRLQAAASFEGVSMSEMVRRLIANVPLTGVIVNGKVNFNKEE